MSSNHREGRDYSEQPLIMCRRCCAIAPNSGNGEFCSWRCAVEHFNDVQVLLTKMLEERKTRDETA